MGSPHYLEVALLRLLPGAQRPEIVGISRDPLLAATVHQALRDELNEALSRVDGAAPEDGEAGSG